VSNTTNGIVQGFGVDESFNVIPGILQDIQVPLGTLTLAKATENVNLAGNLNVSGPTAKFGSVLNSQAFTDLSTNAPATAATLLTDLSEDGVNPSFALNDVIKLNGIEKGERKLGEFTFEVNATPTPTINPDAYGTTLGQYMTFLQDSMGITGAIGPATIGVDVTPTGEIRVEGDLGTFNDLNIDIGDIQSDGPVTSPFQFTKSRDADGESIRTSFPVYDSLGTQVTIDLTITFEAQGNSGTTWRYFAESYQDTDTNLALGNGVLNFDTNGNLVSVSDSTIDINRNNTGATDPMTITLNFSNPEPGVTAFTDTNSGSTLASTFQDGSKIGTLKSFSVETNGIITGSFDNGLSRTLGQVALGTFANPEGLVDVGGNNYINGPNSGLAIEVAPLTFGSARIVSGALELSNVDLSQEFVNLITTSTGFSASSRVITTSDEMLQQLLAII
jgi:flagellar hook protein FlgE